MAEVSRTAALQLPNNCWRKRTAGGAERVHVARSHTPRRPRETLSYAACYRSHTPTLDPAPLARIWRLRGRRRGAGTSDGAADGEALPQKRAPVPADQRRLRQTRPGQLPVVSATTTAWPIGRAEQMSRSLARHTDRPQDGDLEAGNRLSEDNTEDDHVYSCAAVAT